MVRRFIIFSLLLALMFLAQRSLSWGVSKGLEDSADLERRAEEAGLFARRINPYVDPDMTYPPSAPPVFLALIGPVRGKPLRILWIAGNGAALAVFCYAVLRSWGQAWPLWIKVAFCLIAAASKPTRAGMALGQFHLIPMALMMMATGLRLPAQSLLSGLLLGIALIKPTMALPLATLFLFWQKWGTLGAAIGLQFILSFATSVWVRTPLPTLISEWLKNAHGQLSMGTIDVPSILTSAYPSTVLDGSKISLSVLIGSALVLWKLRKRSQLGLVSLSCFLAAIFTYHRHYDMVLLLPAVAYFLDAAVQSKKPAEIVIAGAWAGLLICPTPRGAQHFYDPTFQILAYAGLFWLIYKVAKETDRSAATEKTEADSDDLRHSPSVTA